MHILPNILETREAGETMLHVLLMAS